jgi:Sybindin-like family
MIDMYQALQYIYTHLFVDFVVKNPLFKYNPDEPFNSPLFSSKLEEYLRTSNPAMKQ